MSNSARWVVCAGCGRQMNAAQTPVFYDFESGKSLCQACHQGSGRKTIKRRKWASVLRIAFGVLFFMVFFDEIGSDPSTAFTSLIFGAALLIWQFWPWIKKAFAKSRQQAEVKRAVAAEAEKVKVCPHCGAPGTGSTCTYCGMPLK